MYVNMTDFLFLRFCWKLICGEILNTFSGKLCVRVFKGAGLWSTQFIWEGTVMIKIGVISGV